MAALVALVLPASAGASVQLGVAGYKARFDRLTGQNTQIHLKFNVWNGGLNNQAMMDRFFTEWGPIPMITLNTRNKEGREAITPWGIAHGRGDKYLIQLSAAANRWGKEAYIRAFAEMNGHWNAYCAYNKNGSYRGEAHSTVNFRNAFRRLYLIMHGGARDTINARLANQDMPPLQTSHDLPENPRIKVFWNPQGFGSPNIPKNSANSYYPGDKFVDVVGNDLYDINFRAMWDANLALFKSHPGIPYAIGEWGLWGIDDPAFIRHMAHFASSHPRVKAIAWFKSERGSIFDLASKPKSLRAYKRYIVPLGS
jgi:Glycosyl hydrolase family 26